jgi:hypothetical protein
MGHSSASTEAVGSDSSYSYHGSGGREIVGQLHGV